MNKAILIGRLGQDPKVAYAQTGTTIVNFSIATDESYTDREGNKVDKTEWHRIVTFGKQADFCANYLTKGRLVLVEGSLQTRKWQDQEGQDRYTTEIRALRVQALDSKGQQREQPAEPQEQKASTKPSEQAGYVDPYDKMGEAPF